MRGTLRALSILAAAAAAFRPVSGQEISELTLPDGGNGVSQRAEVVQWIGPVKVTIDYHSPNVHGRGTDRAGHIWGELVPWGLNDEGLGPSRAIPWRAGANESTTIAFSHDVKVGGNDVKAGTYALFLLLDEKGPWTWILSNHPGWGSYQYDPKDDVLRVSSAPQDAPYTEYLTYGFDDRKIDSATAYLQWEKKRVPMQIEVPDVWNVYVDAMRRELEGWPGFNYRNWQTAAQFCADHKVNLEEALVWADRAIREPFRNASFGEENFSTLTTKAAVLKAMGRDAEAEPIVRKALALPGSSVFDLYGYGAGLLAQGKKADALEVFLLNRKRHPEEKFWTYFGLARGYTAVGEKKKAIENWRIAIENVPPPQKPNVPRMKHEIEMLEKGA